MHMPGFGVQLQVPVVPGARCKHTWSGGSQAKQQVPGTTNRPLAVTGALAASLYYRGCWVSPQAHGSGGQLWAQARGMQVYSWSG